MIYEHKTVDAAELIKASGDERNNEANTDRYAMRIVYLSEYVAKELTADT